MCTTLYRTKSFSTILKPLGSYTYAPKGLNYFYVRCSMVLISQCVRPCMVLNVLVRYWKFEYDTGSYNYDPNGHSIHRWWRHYVIITSILDRKITPYLGDLCFRKYSSLRWQIWKISLNIYLSCIKRKSKWVLQFKMLQVFFIICVQLRQKHFNKQAEHSSFTFSYHHLCWT